MEEYFGNPARDTFASPDGIPLVMVGWAGRNNRVVRLVDIHQKLGREGILEDAGEVAPVVYFMAAAADDEVSGVYCVNTDIAAGNIYFFSEEHLREEVIPEAQRSGRHWLTVMYELNEDEM